MTTTITRDLSAAAYARDTESMPADPEARHSRDVASESFSGAFPIETARCATYPTPMEWVPNREQRVVPDLMTALCRRCPGRQTCLLWALTDDLEGYWAGTTTADRKKMRQLDQPNLQTADWLQQMARRELTVGALHEVGEGSYWWYRRRGCRCGECKTANARQRAQERAKTRSAA